jgi:hypothetical protein
MFFLLIFDAFSFRKRRILSIISTFHCGFPDNLLLDILIT